MGVQAQPLLPQPMALGATGEKLQPGKNALKTEPGNAGPGGLMLPQSVERMALGANTASAVAGPKPWDREWITAGRHRLPQLETVFQDPSAPDLTKLLAAMQDQVKGSSTMLEELRSSGAPNVQKAALKASAEPATPQGSVSLPASAEAPAPTGVSAELLAALAAEFGASTEGIEVQDSEESGTGAGRLQGKTNPALSPLGGNLASDDFLATRGLAQTLQGVQAAQNRGDARLSLKDGRGSALGGVTPGKGDTKAVLGAKPRPVVSEWLDSNVRNDATHALQAQGMGGREALTSAMKPRAVELTGHVTTGAMAKSRLSSESLMGMTSSIRTIAGNGVTPSAGEMRIRLNPDHLGELSLKVSTRGKEVGLQIRASNEEAKRVLEESLGHLRENLASNALNLARVEVVLDRGGADGAGLGFQNQQSQSQSQYPQQNSNSAQADLGMMGNWGGNAAGSFGQSGFGRDSERSSRDENAGSVGLSRPRIGGLGPVMNLRSGRTGEAGRVDVMA